MMHQRLALMAAAALGLLLSTAARAELVTAAPAGAHVIDFDAAAGYDTSAPQVQIGTAIGADVRVAAWGGVLNFGAPLGAWSLGPPDGGNGEWTGASFAGVDGAFQDEPAGLAATLVFDFGAARTGVGAFMNFDPTFTYGGGLPLPLYIAAYDAGGVLLEDHFVPVWTPGGWNEGAYFGIALDRAAIARFEVSGPYAVVDTLSLAPVPEPASWALLAMGLASVGLSRRRRV